MWEGNSLNLARFGEYDLVPRAPPSFRPLSQNPLFHQILNIPEGGVGGAFRNFTPFGTRELAGETIQQAVDHQALPVVERSVVMLLPKTGFRQDARQVLRCRFQGPFQAFQKPQEPGGDVETASLGSPSTVTVRLSWPKRTSGAVGPDSRLPARQNTCIGGMGSEV